MRYFSPPAFAVCAALLVGTQAQAQQPLATPPIPPSFSYGTPITLEQAKKVAAAAEAAAKARNMNMVIAVVEPTGDLVYLQKMDGASYGSIQNAQSKAMSAAKYGRPTRVFRERVAKGDLSPMALVGAVASDGGVPIVVEGKTIGAIAASGGADHDIAQAGADALK
jgi:glc operon protein GlcG